MTERVEGAGRPRTMDDVMAEIESIAFSVEGGADKMRALKILKDQQEASVFLPEPLGNVEKMQRLARLMRAAGSEFTREAWKYAFPTIRVYIDEIMKIDEVDLEREDHDLVARVHGLRSLYRLFPELKRSGYPSGFPAGRGKAVQKLWCQQQAIKALRDRRVARFTQPVHPEEANGQVAGG